MATLHGSDSFDFVVEYGTVGEDAGWCGTCQQYYTEKCICDLEREDIMAREQATLRAAYEAACAEEARCALERTEALRRYNSAVEAREAAYDALYPEAGFYHSLDFIPTDEEIEYGLHTEDVDWPHTVTYIPAPGYREA